jgi:hypothetical protein
MVSSNNMFRAGCRSIARAAALLALACGLAPASAAEQQSRPEDRRRFVSVTAALEKAPLDPALADDREWALAWLTEAPDVTVNICGAALGGILESKFPYTSQILFQDMFGMAAFVIERPESANDMNAQQLAGIERALEAYRSILRHKPQAKSPELDKLLETQAAGKLPDFARKAWTRCSSKK